MESVNIFYIVTGVVLVTLAILWRQWGKIRREYWIYDYQRAILFRYGRVIRSLAPGRHVFWGSGWHFVSVDTRRTVHPVANQEIISSDGIAVKVSVTVAYAVKDANKALLLNESYVDSLHTVVQSALRDAVTAVTVEDLLKNRGVIGPGMLEICRPPFEQLGLELYSLEIRDITFPGELKKIFAQVALAKQEGLAALERARGEGAALRHLANAAKLLENNPELMQLRILQSIAEAKQATIVVNPPEGRGLPPH